MADKLTEAVASLSYDDEVAQVDRERAWPFARFHCMPDCQMRARWFEGYYDDQPEGAAIQAFRACRVTSLRENSSANMDAMRVALKPFALAAERLHESTEDVRLLDVFTVGSQLTVGDLRRAATAFCGSDA